MGGNSEFYQAPRPLVWIGNSLVFIGLLLVFTGIIFAFANLFRADGSILDSLGIFLSPPGLGTCKLGLEIRKGKRWPLYFLLVVIFFGSVVIGFFSMAGRETNIGYYIWGIGILLSGGTAILLAVYEKKLLND